jgi:hypothetical protein
MTILRQFTDINHMFPARLILHDEGSGHEKFVTHMENINSGERFWGHYFDNFNSANADFEARVRKCLTT